MSSPLADLFLAVQPTSHDSAGTHDISQGAVCTEWNPTTYENVVKFGTTVYNNLAVLNPAAMAIGQVLLLNTPAKPIILGLLSRAAFDVTDTDA